MGLIRFNELDAFLNVQVNMFSVFVCIVLLFDVNRRHEKKIIQNKIFFYMLISTLFITLIDSGTWIFNGYAKPPLLFLNQTFNYVQFILQPFPIYLWMMYVNIYLKRDKNINKRTVLIFFIPYILYITLILINPITHGMFYFDENGFYHRGNMFIALPILSYSYILCTFAMILKERKFIEKRNSIPLLIFPLPPVIAGIFQFFYYGISFVWPATALSLLIIYVNIQNRRIYTDYLTGVFNRREADSFISGRIRAEAPSFGAVMIDVDKFKEINDTYGHSAGDEAMENVAGIIKEALRSNDFIARYGGDEFLVVLDVTDKQNLQKTIARIEKAVENFNKTGEKPYSLSLSMGYDIYDKNSQMNEDQFIKHIDTLMYKDKSRKY